MPSRTVAINLIEPADLYHQLIKSFFRVTFIKSAKTTATKRVSSAGAPTSTKLGRITRSLPMNSITQAKGKKAIAMASAIRARMQNPNMKAMPSRRRSFIILQD